MSAWRRWRWILLVGAGVAAGFAEDAAADTGTFTRAEAGGSIPTRTTAHSILFEGVVGSGDLPEPVVGDETEVEFLISEYGLTRSAALRTMSTQEVANTLSASLPGGTDPSALAGVLMANDEAGTVIVRVTSERAAKGVLASIDRLGLPRVPVRIELVSWSEDDLIAVYQSLFDRYGKLAGIALWVDLNENRVVLEYDSDHRFLADEVSRIPQVATVEVSSSGGPDACTVNACGQMKGGLRIFHSSNDGGWSATCSSGFNMGTGANPYVVSAGHCNVSMVGSVWWQHNGEYLCPNGNCYVAEGTASGIDTMIFQPYNANWYGVGTHNQLVLFNGNTYGVTGRVLDPALNITVCRSGYVSMDCGTLNSKTASHNGFGNLLRVANLSSCHGDSGGPYYYANKAYGTHNSSSQSACVSTETSYGTRVSTIESYWGVSVRTIP